MTAFHGLQQLDAWRTVKGAIDYRAQPLEARITGLRGNKAQQKDTNLHPDRVRREDGHERHDDRVWNNLFHG